MQSFVVMPNRNIFIASLPSVMTLKFDSIVYRCIYSLSLKTQRIPNVLKWQNRRDTQVHVNTYRRVFTTRQRALRGCLWSLNFNQPKEHQGMHLLVILKTTTGHTWTTILGLWGPGFNDRKDQTTVCVAASTGLICSFHSRSQKVIAEQDLQKSYRLTPPL